jgi:NitT/TauT family transport system substrate-binding protein
MPRLTRIAHRAARSLMVAIALTAAVAMAAPQVHAQQMKKVRIGVAIAALGITYPWLMMPQVLGFWKEEGYDVEVLPIGGSLQVIQQMVGGGIEIGEINASVVIQSNATNAIPVRAIMTNGSFDWSVAVPADSPITTVGQLKGKKIGLVNLATGGIPFLKSYLAANGVSPDKDVELLPIGFGAQAVQAMKAGRVDALFYWGSANATFENQGLKLRYIDDPAWPKLPDFSMVALSKTIDSDPAMIEAIVRGAVKATVFTMANPDCVRQIQWKRWPDTKPTGADDATAAKWDLNSLGMQLTAMKNARELNASRLWGQTNPDAYGRMQDFFKANGLIDKIVPSADLVIRDAGLFARADKFDHAAVEARAKACKLD